MNKKFEIKVYGLDWTFKRTLKGTERMSDFSFSSQINWGQGEVNIELNKDFWDLTYISWDFIQVYVFSDIYLTGKLIYTGCIQRIDRIYTSWISKINLVVLWIASLLTFINYNATKNQDPAQTIKDIIDYFNTKYAWNWLKYDWGFIENFGTNINITFTNKNLLDAIKDIVTTTNFWWTIWNDWQFYFQPYPTTSTHFVTAWKETDSINVVEDSERIINKVYIDYTWWSTTAQDLISQATYWLKEKYESKTDLNNLASANSYANSIISQNKNPKQKITCTINDSFRFKWYYLWDDTETWVDSDTWTERGLENWIEHLTPWDTLTIRNINYEINNLQINKIDYNVDMVKIELSEYDTIAKEIFTN